VVLLGYTKTFTRTNQWHNHARYVVGDGLICGFRVETEREGELNFVLYYGMVPAKRRELLKRIEAEEEAGRIPSIELTVPAPIKTLFQSLCETFLARRNLTVKRYDAVKCENGHVLDSALLRKLTRTGKESTFCNECGKKIVIRSGEVIQFARFETVQVEEQRRTAEKRTRFEQAIFRLQLYAKEVQIQSPECFISYAWGDTDHERWVEHSLARDLQKAGLRVLLDRWDNARVGASITRFLERIANADRVLVVGTPAYLDKYISKLPMGRYVLASEGELIGWRMISSEEGNESALPLLLAGTDKTSFPPLLQGRVYADFRDPDKYFSTMFDVILSLYAINATDKSVADLREGLNQGTN